MERSKSGGVQITRVVSRDQGIRNNHDDQDRDSIDDSDSSDLSLTPSCNGFATLKDYNTGMSNLDDTKHDCGAHDSSQALKNPSYVTCSSVDDGSRSETQTRFRVVKVDSHVPSLKKKGRWTCKSFQEQNAADKGDKQSTTTEDTTVGNSYSGSQINIDSKEADDKYRYTFSYFDMTKVSASPTFPKASTMSQPCPISNEKTLMGQDNDPSSVTVQGLVRSETTTSPNIVHAGQPSPATNIPFAALPVDSYAAVPDSRIGDGKSGVDSSRKVIITQSTAVSSNQSTALPSRGVHSQCTTQDSSKPLQSLVEQSSAAVQSSHAPAPTMMRQVPTDEKATHLPFAAATTANGPTAGVPTIPSNVASQITHSATGQHSNGFSQPVSNNKLGEQTSDKSAVPAAVPLKFNAGNHQPSVNAATRHTEMPSAAALAAAALNHIGIATNMQLSPSAHILTSPVDRPRANSMFTNATMSDNFAGMTSSDLLHPEAMQSLLRKGSMSGMSGLSHALPLLQPNSTLLKTRAAEADQSMRRYVEHLSQDAVAARNSRNMATQGLFSHTGDLNSVVALMHAQQKLEDAAATNDAESRAALLHRQTSTPIVGSATVIEEAGAESHITTSQSAADVTAVSDSPTPGVIAPIDSKIEQAMDLVKSYLMIAVKEEVEDLRERIKTLSERNSQLEYENNVLRATAAADVLAKIPRT